jgi:hypothetical protein
VALIEARSEAEGELLSARAERELAEAKARILMAENLLAAAVGQKFGEVKITHIGSGENPFGSIAQAIASVVEVAKKRELRTPKSTAFLANLPPGQPRPCNAYRRLAGAFFS